MTLLEQVSSLENLDLAFRECLRGHRNSIVVQKVFKDWDRYIVILRKNLQLGQNYPWGAYRSFYITDPKRRLISSAPFIDRVVHRAIHNVLYPILDKHLIPTTFACRNCKGNGHAVLHLKNLLISNPKSYILKMDVKKYFYSINQYILLRKIKKVLPDRSLDALLLGLLKSQDKGLPLGNLTSQMFANFYLNDCDQILYVLSNGRYVRYMDDILVFADSHNGINLLKQILCKIAKKERLKFPIRKRIIIPPGNPIPFLGMLVRYDKVSVLNRSRRRMMKKLRSKIKKGMPDYVIYRSKQSYNAWKNFVN